MTEQREDVTPVGEPSEPAQTQPTAPPPKKGGKKLWVMIVAVVVAILLVSTALLFVLGGGKADYEVVITADGEEVDEVAVDAGLSIVDLRVDVTKNGKSLIGEDGLTIEWGVSDAALGYYNAKAQPNVTFTAGNVGGTGVLNCSVEYVNDDGKVLFEDAPTMDLTVNIVDLDTVVVVPSTKTLAVDATQEFLAVPTNSVSTKVTGATIAWTVTGISAGDYTLSATTGPVVTFSSSVLGTATLTATATYQGATKSGSASVAISETLPGDSRTVDYYWYDIFNVPFGEWWDMRYEIYGEDQPISEEYPYMFIWHGSQPGNTWIYTNIRLNITGRDMPDINMNEWPEFLPLFGHARGGTAVIDWYMQYLTSAEMARYPDATASWSDGWVVSLNGTVTLDKTAAMAMLNLSETAWDNFDRWWLVHDSLVGQSYGSWLTREAGKARLDIYNMYEYPLTMLTWDLTAEKVGEKIELEYDMVTWGMEALITRWMREAFMPTEWYFEDMYFHVTLGPESSRVDIDTVACYSAYAYEGTLDGDPCWGWEGLLQDYVPSSRGHPVSDFDPYVDETYWNFGPGSAWYGIEMPYDYAPGVWNLSAGETLSFTWPDGEVLFPVHVPGDVPENNTFTNVSGPVMVNYCQPIGDLDPELASQIALDNDERLLTYTGPIDMWTWYRTQTTHENLTAEVLRMDGLAPWGFPYVEFLLAYDPEPTSFGIELPATVKNNSAATVTVSCLDQKGRVYEDYDGTVEFTSDGDADLPADYTYDPATDEGVHVFTVTFHEEGTFSLTVQDAANASIIGTVDVLVNPAAYADDLVFEDIPDYAMTAVPFSLTVRAVDQYDDPFEGYTGEVTFTTSDPDVGSAVPPDTPFDAAWNGVHTFTDGFTLVTLGSMTVNVTDSADDSLTDEISLLVFDTEADHIVIEGAPTAVVAGVTFSLTVTAYDGDDNEYMPYEGTVEFTSSDGLAVLPDDYTFVPATDLGSHVFTGAFSLATEGDQTITATDAASLTDMVTIAVSPAPKELTHTIYDLFVPTWAGHWEVRWTNPYYNDILICNETGMVFEVYLPARVGWDYQAMAVAPYKYKLDGKNLTTINVHLPEFMPSLEYLAGVGIDEGPVSGAAATVDIYFQYLTPSYYNNYWMPAWSDAGLMPTTYNTITDDGWNLGTEYEVTMNREAALEWLGMPLTADPAAWWATNNGSYTTIIDDWLYYEGGDRLDVYCAYEAPFLNLFTGTVLREDLSGNIVLKIGNVGWGGYEILMTRWLTEAKITPHQAYMEDFSLTATYSEAKADVSFDGICQYSMQAVLANGTASTCAWVFEAERVDYIKSNAQHPQSDYDLYANLRYQSWNAMDAEFGNPVPYEGTPQWMNLTEGEKLVIEMPTGDVPGFDVFALSEMELDLLWVSWDDYRAGTIPSPDFSDVFSKMSNGTSGLEPGFMVTNYPANDAPYDYDSDGHVLTFEGPLNFDNFRHSPNGPLYHGTPWIEMDVVSGAAASAAPAPAPAESSGAAAGPSVASEMVLMVTAMAAVALVVVALGASAGRRAH